MPIDYEVQIEKANTINDLTNIKRKINYNYYVKHSPSRYSKLMTSIDDKMYLMTLTVKDAKDTLEDEIDNAFNNIKKWEKIHEEKTNKLKELHKNPILFYHHNQ
jgi:hypothetical protein